MNKRETDDDVVIVAAKRTPVGAINGMFRGIPADALGEAVIRALLKQTGVRGHEISEIVLGQIMNAGAGPNPCRQAAIRAGISKEVVAWGLNQLCGSGTHDDQARSAQLLFRRRPQSALLRFLSQHDAAQHGAGPEFLQIFEQQRVLFIVIPGEPDFQSRERVGVKGYQACQTGFPHGNMRSSQVPGSERQGALWFREHFAELRPEYLGNDQLA